jgi:hypothetical protein
MPGRKPGKVEKGGRATKSASRPSSSPKQGATEFVQLVIAYAKQETLDPVLRQLKALGNGIAGAVLLALGTLMLGVGFLRALQTEFGGATGTVGSQLVHSRFRGQGFDVAAPVGHVVYVNAYGSGAHLSGDWSWVPYMGGALFCVAVAVFCAMRIVKGAGR